MFKENKRRLFLKLLGLLGLGGIFGFLSRKADFTMANKKLYKIFKAEEKHWVGNGFYVSTMFSMHSNENYHLSPFLLLDHAAPKHFPPTDEKLGVGEHPHRGFETVTFAIKGEIDHRDSGGGGGTITTGGVQWMTAGSGVVHEEFHSRNFAKQGGDFEMVQLWVNLPAKDKMTTPRYQSINSEDFPVVEQDSLQLKVIAGEFQGKKGPAMTYTPINMYETFNQDKTKLDLNFNNGTNTIVVQLKGESSFSEGALKQGDIAVFERDGTDVPLELEADSHLLILNGEPIDEPVASYGPFVMNTKEELIKAIDDFNAGKMGSLVNEASKN